MERTNDKKEEQIRSNAENVSQEPAGTQTLMPPAFNLIRNAPVQAKPDPQKKEEQGKSAHDSDLSYDTGDPLQLKTKNVTLPEKLGPAQNGPLAVKGEGDKHAFSPNDINQGSIGDCYFLAALAGVANTNPNLLKNAITQNGDGTFTVRLYTTEKKSFLWWKWKKFTPNYIKLYPTFPVSVDGKDSANANADSNPPHAQGGDKDSKGRTELWVRIIEKAYALLMGSYKAIGNGGFSAEALEVLTGKPYTEKVLGDDFKDKIIEMVKNGEPTAVGTSKDTWKKMSKEDKKWAKERSIVGGHAYTVMKADKSKITVRNPWGEAARQAVVEISWDRFKRLFNQYSDKD